MPNISSNFSTVPTPHCSVLQNSASGRLKTSPRHTSHLSTRRLFPFGWFHLLRSLKWKHEDKVELMLIAVHPDYQGKGVNAAFFADLIPVYNSCGITWAETGPQLEDNIRELSQWRILGPKYVKRRRCYTRKIIRGQE